MINELNEPLNYRQEVKNLRLEIVELEKLYRVDYNKNFTKNKFEFDLQVEPSMNMSQGPWQRLGITIEQIMFQSIKHLLTSDGPFPRDYNVEMTIGETIKTSKDLCIGFFDRWEKDLELLQFKYFTEIKEDLLRVKKQQDNAFTPE